MKQNRPDTFKEFIVQFWLSLLAAPFAIGAVLSEAGDKSSLAWQRLLFALFLVAFIGLLFFNLKLVHKAGYFDALYAHYLKRWEKKEQAEAAKLYIGRKEE